MTYASLLKCFQLFPSQNFVELEEVIDPQGMCGFEFGKKKQGDLYLGCSII